MKRHLNILMALLFIAYFSSGCGGGRTIETTNNGITISGVVSAPSGVSLGRSGLRTATDFGLSVKTNAYVEVFKIADSGAIIGDSIASATTNSTGNYSLTLPYGVSIASNLIVVVGSGSNQMRSILTSTIVNINPLTELVASNIISSEMPLSNFTVSEVIAIQVQLENDAVSIDLSAYTTIYDTMVALDAGQIEINLSIAVSIAESGVFQNNVCGNELTDAGEQCDDGNTVSGDGCSSLCALETATQTCGNHLIEGNEQCDDGNTSAGDGCSQNCQTEITTECGVNCADCINTAKNSLFQSSITEQAFNTAKSATLSALALCPDNPDVNLLGAFVDIIGEWDRISSEVLSTPTDIFPIASPYDATTGILERSALTVVEMALGDLPRAGQNLPKNPSAPEVQVEAENALPIVLSINDKLDTVIAISETLNGWSFNYPKDASNPELGYESIDENDVNILRGAIKILTGFSYYGLAYNLEAPDVANDLCPRTVCHWENNASICWADDSYSTLIAFNVCAAADINDDLKLTPDEYFPPNFGALKPDGAVKLNNAKYFISGGFSLLDDAVTNILTEATPDIVGSNLSSALLSDVEYFKHYLTDVSDSFSGITINMTIPDNVICYYLDGTITKSARFTDSTYYATEIDGLNCTDLITLREQHTLDLNLSAIFNITDFRDVMPDFDILTVYDSGKTDHIASTNFVGNTMGGLFPSGIESSWFVTKEMLRVDFSLFDINTGTAINSPISGATLSIDGEIIDQEWWWGSGIRFSTISINKYFNINSLFGTTATLNVPGYQSADIPLTTAYYNAKSVYLMPD